MGSARQGPLQKLLSACRSTFLLFLFWEVGERLSVFLLPHLGFSRTIILGKGGGFLCSLPRTPLPFFCRYMRACWPMNRVRIEAAVWSAESLLQGMKFGLLSI